MILQICGEYLMASQKYVITVTRSNNRKASLSNEILCYTGNDLNKFSANSENAFRFEKRSDAVALLAKLKVEVSKDYFSWCVVSVE
jgi:hypothetical protein